MNRVRLDPASIPAAFALLARAVEVALQDGTELDFLRRRNWLAADPRGGVLLIGPDWMAEEAPRSRELPAAAVRLRGRFTGRDTDGRSWTLPRFPREWEDLGPAESILYESDKVNGGGTGRAELFRHEFSPGANAYRAGDLVAIVGKRIRVDAAGVRN